MPIPAEDRRSARANVRIPATQVFSPPGPSLIYKTEVQATPDRESGLP